MAHRGQVECRGWVVGQHNGQHIESARHVSCMGQGGECMDVGGDA